MYNKMQALQGAVRFLLNIKLLLMPLPKHSYNRKVMKEKEELFETNSGLQKKYLKTVIEYFINLKIERWLGPGKVVFHDRKVVFVRQGFVFL